MNGKLKIVGQRTLKYIVFLAVVMAWMIVLGPKETLTAEEQMYVQEFIAELESQPAQPTQVASETPIASSTQYGVIIEDNVNVRQGPGLDFTAVRQLFKGDEVELVSEIVGGWWKINLEGAFYYVKSDFVSVNTLTGFNQ